MCLIGNMLAFSLIKGDGDNVVLHKTNGTPSYGVEVIDACSNVVVSTTVSGYGTDYVYLPASMCSGEATIIVSTPSGNEYEGTFTVP